MTLLKTPEGVKVFLIFKDRNVRLGWTPPENRIIRSEGRDTNTYISPTNWDEEIKNNRIVNERNRQFRTQYPECHPWKK